AVATLCVVSSPTRAPPARSPRFPYTPLFRSGKKLTPLRNVKRQEGCSFPACPREHYSKGYCQYHARQHREGKTLTPAPAWRAAASWKKSAEDRVDPETGKRWCTICKRWLSADQFGANRATADGVHYHCSRCASLARFSLTSIEYEQMLEAQGGVCKLCGGVNDDGRSLAVDHDHSCCPEMSSCGKCIRYLLCYRCNMALGYFRDNPEVCEKAADYLREFQR